MCAPCVYLRSHLYIEGQTVLFEGIEVKDELLPTLGQWRQVSIAMHKDGLALQNLSIMSRTNVKQILKAKINLCLFILKDKNISYYRTSGWFKITHLTFNTCCIQLYLVIDWHWSESMHDYGHVCV